MYRLITSTALAFGLLATVAGTAGAQTSGQGLPPGSYQQSCTNVSMRGSTLSASCTDPSGRRVYSSLNVNNCGGSSVQNINGQLSCNGYYGNGQYNNGQYNNGQYNNGRYGQYGQGNGQRRHRRRDRDDDNGQYNGGYNNGQYNNGGYGNGQYGGYMSLPGGSYQRSCTNATMRGSRLSASCTNASGQRVYSSLDVTRCESRGSNIANIDGRLRCR